VVPCSIRNDAREEVPVAGKSEEAVAAALTTVLRDHGWAVASNPKRLRGALSDVLGSESDQHRGVLDAIVIAVEEGVVDQLREAGRDGVEGALPDLVPRLAAWGLTGERATWAVLTWAHLLPEATLPPPVLTAEPPDTRPEALAPTTLPPMVTAPAPAGGPGAALAITPGVTIAPDPPSRSGGLDSGAMGGRRSRRSAVLVAVAAAVVLSAGGVAAAMNWPEEDPSGPTASDYGSTDASTSSDDPPPQAEAGAVIAAATTTVPAGEAGAAMAAAAGGVRIARLGEVETVGAGEDERSAPEGGRLIAFKLADWPCELGSCRPWSKLGLKIAVGGDERRLPVTGGADTFVVAVPAGVTDVDLRLRADRLTQSLSLVTGEPGPDNVEVLARSRRVDRIGERFNLVERTSTELDYGSVVTDTVPRDVKVTRAELSFFTVHGRPSSPQRAFLKLRAEYTIPFGPSKGPVAFYLQEVGFVARDGTRYDARDIDEGPGLNAVFEVPADLRGGTFVLGGGSYPTTAGDGSSFTRTLAQRRIPVSFG